MASVEFRHQVNNGLLALAFVLILGTSLFSVASTNALSDSIELVNHTRKILSMINRMDVALGRVESDGLRYMISGRATFEMEHRHALAELKRLKVDLRTEIRDNPLQRAYLADFNDGFAILEARSNQALAIKREAIRVGDEISPIKRIRESKSSSVVRDLFSVLANMTEEENKLMLTRAAERDALVKQTNATVLIANALALVAGVLGFVAIRRSQREADKMLLIKLQAEQARRASEEKSAFLANVSHEIRTPMNAIFGFTQLLSESVTAPLERDWVQSIKKSGQMLLSLINDVLDLSKIESGKMQLHLQPTDVRALVDETVKLFLPLASEKGIFLTREIDLQFQEPLVLDSQRLRQVLMNLVSNAVKYTEHGGVVVRLIFVRKPDPSLCDLHLLVSDSGLGILPEQIERIFEPFHQADSPDGKVRQGTGLGLSITRRLIDIMQGTIHVESELKKGSTFVVKIPQVSIVEAVLASADESDIKVDFNRLPRLTILAVDDVAWNAEVAKGYLRNSHHSVHTASDGIEAVAATRKLQPNVVLMDMRMPRMDGYQARDAIRADPTMAQTAIIAVTASSLTSEENTLRESFNGYIRKPYSPNDLFAALEAIFGAEAKPSVLATAPQKWNPPLRERWHKLRGSSLVELRSSMRIREIGDYAQQLHAFASDAQFSSLRTQALMLQTAVQQFDISAVTAALTNLATWPEDFDDA
jgi:signal transduction histidine kinase/AmiR/NasT family two-component response regulator